MGKKLKNKLIFWFWIWLICSLFTGIFYRIPLILSNESLMKWNIFVNQHKIQIFLQIIGSCEYISLILTIIFIVRLSIHFVEKENQ